MPYFETNCFDLMGYKRIPRASFDRLDAIRPILLSLTRAGGEIGPADNRIKCVTTSPSLSDTIHRNLHKLPYGTFLLAAKPDETGRRRWRFGVLRRHPGTTGGERQIVWAYPDTWRSEETHYDHQSLRLVVRFKMGSGMLQRFFRRTNPWYWALAENLRLDTNVPASVVCEFLERLVQPELPPEGRIPQFGEESRVIGYPWNSTFFPRFTLYRRMDQAELDTPNADTGLPLPLTAYYNAVTPSPQTLVDAVREHQLQRVYLFSSDIIGSATAFRWQEMIQRMGRNEQNIPRIEEDADDTPEVDPDGRPIPPLPEDMDGRVDVVPDPDPDPDQPMWTLPDVLGFRPMMRRRDSTDYTPLRQYLIALVNQIQTGAQNIDQIVKLRSCFDLKVSTARQVGLETIHNFPDGTLFYGKPVGYSMFNCFAVLFKGAGLSLFNGRPNGSPELAWAVPGEARWICGAGPESSMYVIPNWSDENHDPEAHELFTEDREDWENGWYSGFAMPPPPPWNTERSERVSRFLRILRESLYTEGQTRIQLRKHDTDLDSDADTYPGHLFFGRNRYQEDPENRDYWGVAYTRPNGAPAAQTGDLRDTLRPVICFRANLFEREFTPEQVRTSPRPPPVDWGQFRVRLLAGCGEGHERIAIWTVKNRNWLYASSPRWNSVFGEGKGMVLNAGPHTIHRMQAEADSLQERPAILGWLPATGPDRVFTDAEIGRVWRDIVTNPMHALDAPIQLIGHCLERGNIRAASEILPTLEGSPNVPFTTNNFHLNWSLRYPDAPILRESDVYSDTGRRLLLMLVGWGLRFAHPPRRLAEPGEQPPATLGSVTEPGVPLYMQPTPVEAPATTATEDPEQAMRNLARNRLPFTVRMEVVEQRQLSTLCTYTTRSVHEGGITNPDLASNLSGRDAEARVWFRNRLPEPVPVAEVGAAQYAPLSDLHNGTITRIVSWTITVVDGQHAGQTFPTFRAFREFLAIHYAYLFN